MGENTRFFFLLLKEGKHEALRFRKNRTSAATGAKTLAAIAIAATVSVADVHEAYAAKDISGLTKCAKSKPYAKREKQAVKALQKRLKKYEEGSAGANAINSSIAATKKRFKMYANSGVLRKGRIS